MRLRAYYRSMHVGPQDLVELLKMGISDAKTERPMGVAVVVLGEDGHYSGYEFNADFGSARLILALEEMKLALVKASTGGALR